MTARTRPPPSHSPPPPPPPLRPRLLLAAAVLLLCLSSPASSSGQPELAVCPGVPPSAAASGSATMSSEAIRDVVPRVGGHGVALKVTYGQATISDGMSLTRAQAGPEPRVEISGAAADVLHTLVMVDPDAPSPDSPTMAQWIHWIVANIPGGNLAKGATITPYNPPTPPRGTHRYIFLLYEQPKGVQLPATRIEQRAKFNVASWATDHELGDPVAAVHYKTAATQ